MRDAALSLPGATRSVPAAVPYKQAPGGPASNRPTPGRPNSTGTPIPKESPSGPPPQGQGTSSNQTVPEFMTRAPPGTPALVAPPTVEAPRPAAAEEQYSLSTSLSTPAEYVKVEIPTPYRREDWENPPTPVPPHDPNLTEATSQEPNTAAAPDGTAQPFFTLPTSSPHVHPLTQVTPPE